MCSSRTPVQQQQPHPWIITHPFCPNLEFTGGGRNGDHSDPSGKLIVAARVIQVIGLTRLHIRFWGRTAAGQQKKRSDGGKKKRWFHKVEVELYFLENRPPVSGTRLVTSFRHRALREAPACGKGCSSVSSAHPKPRWRIRPTPPGRGWDHRRLFHIPYRLLRYNLCFAASAKKPEYP